MSLKDETVFVAGHGGMVGSAVCRSLTRHGIENILTRSRDKLDLTDQGAVADFFNDASVDHVVIAAARVGGIHANNTFPADFIYDNVMIEANVIHQAFKAGVKRLLLLGSSCIYPKLAEQPMKEECFLTGKLEPTNAPYAVAKIAGIHLCEAYNRQHGMSYRAVMPTNLYGPNDNFDLETSHVLPALIRKCHLAKLAGRGDVAAVDMDEQRFGPIPTSLRASLGLTETAKGPVVPIWGTGEPFREFMHVDDLADACLFVMGLTDVDFGKATASHGQPFINVGTGKEITIRDLVSLIAGIVGYEGTISWDDSRPDGTPRKVLDVSLLNGMGWTSKTTLTEGIRRTYAWYKEVSEVRQNSD